MTYQELVEKVKTTLEAKDASAVDEHVAIQFNVTGEAEGIFYLEIKDQKVMVEPYDYNDRDVMVIADADAITKIADGKLSLELAYTTGKIKAEGNLGKALLLKKLKDKKAAKPAKKATGKAKK